MQSGPSDQPCSCGSDAGITANLRETIRDESTVGTATGITPGVDTATTEITTTRFSAVVDDLTTGSEYPTVWTHLADSAALVFTDHRTPAASATATCLLETGVHYEPTVRMPEERPNQTLINTTYLATAAEELTNTGSVITVHVDDAGLLGLVPDTGPGLVISPTVTASHPKITTDDLVEFPQSESLARNEEGV